MGEANRRKRKNLVPLNKDEYFRALYHLGRVHSTIEMCKFFGCNFFAVNLHNLVVQPHFARKVKLLASEHHVALLRAYKIRKHPRK